MIVVLLYCSIVGKEIEKLFFYPTLVGGIIQKELLIVDC